MNMCNKKNFFKKNNPKTEIEFKKLQNHDLTTIDDLRELFPFWRRESILKKIRETEKGKDVRFVATLNGKIIAHVKYILGKSLHKHRVEMVSLIVEENERRKGIAKKLVNFSLKNLPPHICLIILAVDKKNKPAINLYKKLGFKEHGLLKNASKINNKFVDNLLMNKKIKKIKNWIKIMVKTPKILKIFGFLFFEKIYILKRS